MTSSRCGNFDIDLAFGLPRSDGCSLGASVHFFHMCSPLVVSRSGPFTTWGVHFPRTFKVCSPFHAQWFVYPRSSPPLPPATLATTVDEKEKIAAMRRIEDEE